MKRKTTAPQKFTVFLLLAAALVMFTFCGCTINNDSDTLKGILEDSALTGVHFSSYTISGETGMDGGFQYFQNYPVTFSVGGVSLGTISGKPRLTLLDLVPGATDVTDPSVTNMARFLQSLDDDSDPSNGIYITSAIAASLSGQSLDFTQDTAAFETAATTILTPLGKTLVSAAKAQDHLRATILGPFTHSVASGDPRPDSVILWTRAYDEDAPSADLNVDLVVSANQDLSSPITTETLTAKAEYDHCVKVKIDGLSAKTYYYYQFNYEKNGIDYKSPLGRTKTAPAADDDVEVKWAFFSGQDYSGKYYNSFEHLLNTFGGEDDLDFLVHIGDYVYENDGDPSFQTLNPDRAVVFTDVDGAIERGEGDATFHSAKSLSNYRTLYKTFRSDMMLQKLHEKYPMIVIWDDHEFADDSWQDVATYFNGKKNEADATRKKTAEQVFFEYMPCEIGIGGNGQLDITDDILYPNAQIYRNFKFGKNLDLVMTDYRSYRPDHLIPEDAFPGKIVMDQATTQAMLGEAFPLYEASLEPYVDIDDAAFAAVKAGLTQILTGLYAMDNEFITQEEAGAKAAAAAQGNVSARYINGAFMAASLDAPFPDTSAFDKGIAYLTMGKTDLYSQYGARYLVSQDLFTLYANYLAFANQGTDTENAFGTDQQTWMESTIQNSAATWKVLASSVSMTPMILDFTHPNITPLLPANFPDDLKARLQVNADQWDGFPLKKAELLNFLSTVSGALVISGDIHSSFLTDHGDRSAIGGGTNRVYEFTGTSVSSETIGEMIGGAAESLGIPGVDDLIPYLDLIFTLSSMENPNSGPSQIVYDDTHENGYVVMDATSDAMYATYYHYPSAFVTTRFYDNFADLAPEFTETTYKIENNTLTQEGGS